MVGQGIFSSPSIVARPSPFSPVWLKPSTWAWHCTHAMPKQRGFGIRFNLLQGVPVSQPACTMSGKILVAESGTEPTVWQFRSVPYLQVCLISTFKNWLLNKNSIIAWFAVGTPFCALLVMDGTVVYLACPKGADYLHDALKNNVRPSKCLMLNVFF